MQNNPWQKRNKDDKSNNRAGNPFGAGDITDKYDAMNKQKRSQKVSGFYPDDDIHEVLLKKQKQYGKGYKSDLINELLRDYFESKGWLDEPELEEYEEVDESELKEDEEIEEAKEG